MRTLIPVLMVLLAVLHHDFWWWNDIDPLVLGFLPVGLAYHALISILAGIGWALAARYCWPSGLEVEDSDVQTSASRGGHA